ncbi:hypothetical protein SAMN05446635_6719 [Burkholderia sp. OK233]|nr:hypothetical protein SAMN05446635_6719 [Burkholderia sp. OK233]
MKQPSLSAADVRVTQYEITHGVISNELTRGAWQDGPCGNGIQFAERPAACSSYGRLPHAYLVHCDATEILPTLGMQADSRSL